MKTKVLIVEDQTQNMDVAKSVCSEIKRDNVEFVFATNFVDALEIIKNHKEGSLRVITDRHLPHTDGSDITSAHYGDFLMLYVELMTQRGQATMLSSHKAVANRYDYVISLLCGDSCIPGSDSQKLFRSLQDVASGEHEIDLIKDACSCVHDVHSPAFCEDDFNTMFCGGPRSSETADKIIRLCQTVYSGENEYDAAGCVLESAKTIPFVWKSVLAGMGLLGTITE